MKLWIFLSATKAEILLRDLSRRVIVSALWTCPREFIPIGRSLLPFFQHLLLMGDTVLGPSLDTDHVEEAKALCATPNSVWPLHSSNADQTYSST